MSSIEETEGLLNDAIDGVTREPEPETPETPEVEQAETPDEGEQPAAEEAILGKFKTQDDLVKAYQELERQFTQERQQQPAPEPEPEEDPYNPLQNFAIGFDDADRQQIANSTMVNPEKTLAWAMSAEISEWSPNLKNEVYQLWHSFDPIAAQTYTAKIAVAQEREQVEQLRAEWAAEQSERQAEQAVKNANIAFSEIQKNLPDFDRYRARVHELFTAKPLADDDARLSDPKAMEDFVETLYSRARWEEFKRQEAAAQTPAQPAKAGGKTRTQTRSTATPAASIPEADADFLNEVLAGQPDRD
jgi:hypothetical protein